ncbi:hypothetical protein M977_00214 [Buttiauxella gaviniae ATCC 51604]|uniref:Uncharacterized protein n=1 Tax=Buttiauxella gaviniae ATCC 51604 TaxID=1354253 RepID=A0A1B7I6C7_9ENTR|nr:hypothetical protein [Buttiauxella gaviniae]OAT23924.1 hypothetical protein M977_00214 [Buttiauxella gaviniae ATCC 51604]
MKRILSVFILAVLLLSPWLVALKLDKRNGVELYCQVPYVLNSDKENSMQLKGTIKTHYYPDGSGIGILSGNMRYLAQGSSKPVNYTIHRNTRFSYQLDHSYITTHTKSMHPAYGENIPDAVANEYIFPSFKDHFKDYYQIQRTSNGDMIVSVANMPRLYCHTAG